VLSFLLGMACISPRFCALAFDLADTGVIAPRLTVILLCWMNTPPRGASVPLANRKYVSPEGGLRQAITAGKPRVNCAAVMIALVVVIGVALAGKGLGALR
jgi:hypothetical protein